MPAGAQVLSAQYQEAEGGIVVWALVDPSVLPQTTTFLVMATGQPLDIPSSRTLQFVGTVPYPGGRVFHILQAVAR